MVSPMTTDHRAEALKELTAATVARIELGREYAEPRRDHDRIGELRYALKNALGFATVHALLDLGALPVSLVDPWPDTHEPDPEPSACPECQGPVVTFLHGGRECPAHGPVHA
jgi:hypothetical protein